MCYDRYLAAARIRRREGQGTDCRDGFSLPLRCALIRDSAQWSIKELGHSLECVIYFL